jgi:hypothetical protein
MLPSYKIIFVCGVPAVIGVALSAQGLFSLYKLRQCQSWPRVPGRITRSESTQIVGSSVLPVDSFEIEYEFEYLASRIGRTPVMGHKVHAAHRAKELLAKYRVGDRVMVFVDPSNPSFNCLELVSAKALSRMIAWGVVLLSLGAIAMTWAFASA